MSRNYERVRHRRRRTDVYGIVPESEQIRITILRRRRRPGGVDRRIVPNFDDPDIITTRPRHRHRLPFSFQSSFLTSGNDRPRSLSYSFSFEGPNSVSTLYYRPRSLSYSSPEGSNRVSTLYEFADGHIIINMNESNSQPNPHPPRHHGAMGRVIINMNEYSNSRPNPHPPRRHGAMVINENTPLDTSTSHHHHHHHHHHQRQRQRQRQRRCSELEPREQAGLGHLSEETISSSLITRVSFGHQETQICVICQVEYENNELMIGALSCNHCFHVNCITRWLQERNMCPLCRAIPRGS